jgi:ppGpp synthetase/RelA/SpoT-type nucleotidyltranferase
MSKSTSRISDKATNNEILRDQYHVKSIDADRIIRFLIEQLNAFVEINDIALGFPVSSRIKDFHSILEKISRKNREISSVTDLDDFAGVRIVVLFKKDIIKFHDFIVSNLEVISFENTLDRLDESSFGYQSNHYVIKLPEGWRKIPSLTGLDNFRVEIQVRTIAQHIWAAASHKLQYKAEATVPNDVKRAISRASAVLELVDLEFDRVLEQRNNYIENIEVGKRDTTLNVDLLREILTEQLPQGTGVPDDRYDKILEELFRFEISKPDQLIDIIKRRIDQANEEDNTYRSDPDNKQYTSDYTWENGRYFTHWGLVRNILRFEFGTKKADEILNFS